MVFRFIAKWLLFLVNLIFAILGLAIVALGVFVKLKLQDYWKELKDQIEEASSSLVSTDAIEDVPIDIVAYSIIVLGAVIFLIAFCGCCGSVTESKCLLITYFFFIGTLTVLKIVLLVMLIKNSANLRNEAETFVDEAFLKPEYNITFHGLEAIAKCCGTVGPDSYNISYNGSYYAPPTCCGMKLGDSLTGLPSVPDNMENINSTELADLADLASNSTIEACLIEDAYQIGCTKLIGNTVADILIITHNVLIIMIASESLLLICTLYIVLTIKTKI